MRYAKLVLALIGALNMQMARAVPTPEEAAQLGKTLTPMGAIKAGNKEGTIPEWTGGVCTPPAGYKPKAGLEAGGSPHIDVFANDKPLFKITAENMAQYADKLDDGAKELLKRFPKTYYMNVYPTRRSACFPNFVYENTIKKVMNPRIVGGDVPSVTGAHAQVPFPIPKSGVEVMWNKMTTYALPLSTGTYINIYVDGGRKTLIDADTGFYRRAYWDNTITMVPDDKPYLEMSANKSYPPSMNGNVQLMHSFLRPDLRGDPVWSYIPGQRRVRRAPEFAYDGVAPSAGGVLLYDEGIGFMGKMDRFDFKLLGRKEMYVSYNSAEEKMSDAEAATPNHIDPAAVRWELHRVWHVEATLKPGERHVQKKKVFYFDEDSWQPAIYYGTDHAGDVHHLYYFHLSQAYEVPGIQFAAITASDLKKGVYFHQMFSGSFQGVAAENGKRVKSIPSHLFTPEGMAGAAVR